MPSQTTQFGLKLPPRIRKQRRVHKNKFSNNNQLLNNKLPLNNNPKLMYHK